MNFVQIEHPAEYANSDISLRHYCRNLHCRSKLKAPVDNFRKAFCCTGCHASFYLKRCVVCEKPKPAGRSDRKFCRKPKCRAEYYKYPALFGEDARGIVKHTDSSKSAHSTGTKTGGLDSLRPWRVVAGPVISATVYHNASLPLDPDTARRTDAANDWDRIRRETDWSQRVRHRLHQVQS